MLRASGRLTKPRDKADALAQISQRRPHREGGVGQDRRAANGPRPARAPHRDLDKAVPDKPLLITLSGWWGIINSKALAELKKRYPGTDRPGDDGSG